MTTSSSVDRVRAEIADAIAARRATKAPASTTMESAMESAVTGTAPSPWFSHTDAAPTGKVRLSTLVPSWDKSKGTLDPWVTVPDRSTFTADAVARIPAVNPHYRPQQDTLAMLAYAFEDTKAPVMLTGLPSVGKSSIVEYFCAITGRPFYRFNYNGTMDSSSLLGTQSASGGATHWHDGMVTEAVQVPFAILLHDEWTFAPAEVIAAMQYLTEVNGKLILADKPGSVEDKTIIPQPTMRMVFADNTKGQGDVSGKFVGTQPQNTATLDRIGTFIEVQFMSESDERAMLAEMFPHATSRLIRACVKVANLCRNGYVQGNISTIMSLRCLTAWIQHAINIRDIDKALDMAYLNRFDSEAEKQAVRSFVDITFGKR